MFYIYTMLHIPIKKVQIMLEMSYGVIDIILPRHQNMQYKKTAPPSNNASNFDYYLRWSLDDRWHWNEKYC